MTSAKKPLRRRPKQERSLNRVGDILESALALVGEKGIAALTMREIAAASGMPLASIYQYFPNKSAVIAMLYERFSEETRTNLSDALASVKSVGDIQPVACGVVDTYYQRLAANPAYQDLLNAIQADKALQNIDIAETRKQAGQFIEATKGFMAEDVAEPYGRAVHLLFYLAGGTVRLALMGNRQEGLQFVEDYKNLIRAQLAPFGG